MNVDAYWPSTPPPHFPPLHTHTHGADLFSKIWESLNEEIRRFLWNPKVHYCVQRNRPLDPVMLHTNPIHIVIPYFLKRFSKIFTQLCLDPWGCTFLSGFPKIGRRSEWPFPWSDPQIKGRIYVYITTFKSTARRISLHWCFFNYLN
jgi:hypothetical protein